MDEKLKVGRELDALVAKVVFEVEVVSFNDDDELYITEIDDTTTPLLPYYSTDTRAAFQIVERLIQDERLDTFDLQWCSEDSPQVPNEHRWYAIFIPLDDGEWCSGYGDTRAEAICRAAVEWMRVEDE